MTSTPDVHVPAADLGGAPGHVFVVNGVLEGLGRDAAIIPTDVRFTVSEYWREAVGLERDDSWLDLRPDGWGQGSAERGKARPGRDGAPLVWFLDVASPRADELGAQAARCIRAMVAADAQLLLDSAASAGRRKPLVAVPVIGVGRGGHGADRGAVIRQLLAHVSEAARDCRVDVAIVARSRADYAAFQHLRAVASRAEDFMGPLHRELVVAAQDLGRMAANGELALFIGAGVSMSAGLPSWSGLINELAAAPEVQEALAAIDLDAHGQLEQATLLEAAAGSAAHLDAQIAAIIRKTRTPGLAHVLLAGLRCREVVTTNYDTLYEKAADAIRPDGSAKVSVAPWQRASGDAPWILKMHGDVEHAGTTVLTRHSFVRYDAHWKPVGSIVQSLMMTRHLLVVGASMTDDNLVRFAHEVGELRETLGHSPAAGGAASGIGTIVALADDPALRMLWESRFAVVGVAPVPTPSASAPEERRAIHGRYAARELMIFLDAVGMYAVRDASYLLDRSYEPTSDEGQAVAETLQALGPRLAALARTNPQGDWARLGSALTAFGLEIREG